MVEGEASSSRPFFANTIKELGVCQQLGKKRGRVRPVKGRGVSKWVSVTYPLVKDQPIWPGHRHIEEILSHTD